MNKDIHVYKKLTHSLNTNNGILNKENLKFAITTFLYSAMKENTELVKIKQHYPVNDISDVDMEVDFVIVNRNRYDKLIENQIEEPNIQYLKFPKLENNE
jgi:hypothetical protein